MPREYIGETMRSGGLTIHAPRKWTKPEIEWCEKLRDCGYTARQIAESVDRDVVSVSIKMKRLRKADDTYNLGHVKEKYATNKAFVDMIKPRLVCDVYAGRESWYKKNGVDAETNDIAPEARTNAHMDALRFLCKTYSRYGKDLYDIVDLDPFGSAYECFDLSVKLATKGLVVTFGEMGHLRWKRLDYVSRHYGITRLKDFTLGNLIKEVQRIGLCNKKQLTPVFVKQWTNVSRVWFKVERIKIDAYQTEAELQASINQKQNQNGTETEQIRDTLLP